jgi:hypothetical protein
MKKVVNGQEVEDAGLIALLGKKVLLFGTNYNYAGVLTGVNDDCVTLTGARLVFETGQFNDPAYKDAQPLPSSVWCVRLAAIESYGASDK